MSIQTPIFCTLLFHPHSHKQMNFSLWGEGGGKLQLIFRGLSYFLYHLVTWFWCFDWLSGGSLFKYCKIDAKTCNRECNRWFFKQFHFHQEGNRQKWNLNYDDALRGNLLLIMNGMLWSEIVDKIVNLKCHLCDKRNGASVNFVSVDLHYVKCFSNGWM